MPLIGPRLPRSSSPLRTAWLTLLVGAAGGVLVTSACSSSNSDPAPTPGAASDDGGDANLGEAGDALSEAGADTSPADAADSADAGSCPGASDAAPDDARVSLGMGLVTANHCANCHQESPSDAGIELSGRTTPLTDAGSVYPKNLTPDPTTGIGCWTDDQLKRAILTGIDDEGKPLCVMPKFGKAGLSDDDATSIVAFLRSRPPVHKVIPDTVCPAVDAGPDAPSD